MIPRTGILVSNKELLGLLLVFVAYVLLGGLVFMLLEGPLEESDRRDVDLLRADFHDKLERLGDPNVTQDDIRRLLLKLSSAHRKSLINEDGEDTHTIWSFGNSFFFAITVVTTIGYGHLSPSTTPGRLFCVVYATIGIPLTGILLAAIGGHFSQRLVRGLQRARRSRHSRLALTLSAARCLLPWLLAFLVLPAGCFVWLERWSFVDSFYYCFITLSTIGFGDFVASNTDHDYVGVYKTFVVLWIIFGLGYLAMILNYISRMMRCKQIRRVERKLSTSIYHTQQKMGQRLDEMYQIIHDASRNRTIRPKKRPGLKRMQSFPAPELKDRNHNHKIQKLLRLVQTLKEEEPAPRPRRLSLPLPATGGLSSASYGRGSLQVFSTTTLSNHLRSYQEVVENGYQLKPPKPVIFISATDCRYSVEDPSNNNSNTLDRYHRINVNSDETIVSVPDGRTVIELEGLQCTRV